MSSKVSKKFGALEVVGTSHLNGIIVTKSTVGQLTSVTSGVSINSPAGIISTVSTALATNGSAVFSVSNSCVEADSIVLANIVNYGGSQGAPIVRVQGITRGSFSVSLRNVSDADALNGVVKVGFSVL
jgi:hypothetical protein